MTKTEKDIIEEIWNKYNLINDYWDTNAVKESIVEGIKAGRKQFAEEILIAIDIRLKLLEEHKQTGIALANLKELKNIIQERD